MRLITLVGGFRATAKPPLYSCLLNFKILEPKEKAIARMGFHATSIYPYIQWPATISCGSVGNEL